MSQTDDVSQSILTPLRFLERSVAVYPDKTAVVHGHARYTYAEFAQRCYRLGSALRAAGIARGDRVAVLCPNIPPMLEAHFGVPAAGGVLVAINTRLSPPEVAYIINHCGAKLLIVDTELAETIRPVASELDGVETIVNVRDSQEGKPLDGLDFEEFLGSGNDDATPLWPEDERETIAINYTSGTTGRPKGVMYSHRGAYLNALGETLETDLTWRSVYLWTLPMFHCNGWCFTWGVTGRGATNVCLRKVDPAAIWSLIEREGVTHLNGAPIVLTTMLNHADRPERLAKPLTATLAGAPPSPTLLEQMQSLGARAVHAYGLTETYGPHTVCAEQEQWNELPAQEQARRRARQGVNFVMTEPVRVVDDEMNDVPRDAATMGEVVMRGDNVMKGYYDDPEATAKAFRGGWFHSGDLAVMHPDGYIELRDRSKDIIITGGENVSSIEVEQALCRHDSVLEVAVLGIPHEKWGETPKAFVTLKEGLAASEEELIEFCRGQLAHFKCPSAVEFTALPKTSTGKIQKYALREKEWAGQEKRIQGA